MIIEATTCPSCGAELAADAKRCPGCGAKRHRPKIGRPPAHGLPPDELLAKIDALDWDGPMTLPAPAKDLSAAPPAGISWVLPAALGALLLLAGVSTYLFLGADTAPAGDEPPAAIAAVDPMPPAQVVGDASLIPAERLAAVEAAEREREAKLEAAVRRAEDNAKRKAAIERRRKAEAEERALQEQEQRERELRAQEEARQRAEREAAEARARAAAVPQGPASPKELCAGEAGVFSRGMCESRACAQSQWKSHPFCVKRFEDQMRRLGG